MLLSRPILCAAAFSCVLHVGLLGVAAGLLVTHRRATTAWLKVTLLQPAVPLPAGAHKGSAADAWREEKPPEPTSPPPKPQTPKPKLIAPPAAKMKKPQPPKEVVAPAPAAPPSPAASTLPSSQEGKTDGVSTGDNVVEQQGLGGDSKGSGGTTTNALRNGGGGASARPDYGVNPKPPYPFMARRMGAQGVVLLRVHVRADGSVAEVQIGQSSGFLLLDNSALQTVRDSWRFIPARLDGVPVESWVEVPIRFVLGDS